MHQNLCSGTKKKDVTKFDAIVAVIKNIGQLSCRTFLLQFTGCVGNLYWL